MRKTTYGATVVFFALAVAAGCNSDASSSGGSEGDTWNANVDAENESGDEVSDGGTDGSRGSNGDTERGDSGDEEDSTTGGDAGIKDASDAGETGDTTLNPDTLPTSFGPGSFLRHFYIDDEASRRSETEGFCCYDFSEGSFANGTDNDNAVAELIASVGGVVGITIESTNASINQRIEAGVLTYLMEFQDWSAANASNDDSVELSIFKGEDADDSFQDNLAGDGSFLLTRTSFRPSGEPKWSFDTASVENGVLEASGGNVTLQLQLLFGITLRLRLIDPQLQADVATGVDLDLQSGGTVPLNDGKLAGKIPKSDIYTGFNRAVSTCGCLGGEDLLTDPNDDDRYSCAEKQGSCSCPSRLEQIIDRCGALTGAVRLFQDFDTNNTPGPDALSVGASFDAVGAQITGVSE